MTADLELADRFVAYLRAFAQGEAAAQTAVTICRALNLPPSETGRRQLRACAQHAVKAGTLVCSTHRGYYVPATRDETEAAVSKLQGEAFALLDRAKRARKLSVEQFGEAERPELPLFAEVGA